MVWLAVLLSWLSGLTVGYSSYNLGSDIGAYDDVLMQDLYRRLAGIDPSYFLEREDELAPIDDSELYESPSDWIGDDAPQLKSRPRSPVAGGQTDTRDSEYIGHSSNAATDGFIYMSGIALYFSPCDAMPQLAVAYVFVKKGNCEIYKKK